MSYYGTAVWQPTGTGRPRMIEIELPPREEIVWCEEAGCPRSQCVKCQQEGKS